MTVFATSVLDNFNRADESPLSFAAGWAAASIISGGQALAVSTTKASGGPGSANVPRGQLRASAVGNANQEAYVTIGGLGGSQVWELWARAQNPGGSSLLGYRAYWGTNGAGAWTGFAIDLGRYVGGVYTSLYNAGFPSGVSPVAGDKMGIRVYGSTPVAIESWYYNAATSGPWQRVASVRDSDAARLTGDGALGLGLYATISAIPVAVGDDFGGGAASPTTIADVFPTLTGTYSDRFLAVSGSKRAAGATGKSNALAPLLARRAWPTPSGPARPAVGQIWPYGGNA